MRTVAALLLALGAGGCDGSPSDVIYGYVEGDYLRISLPESGIVTTRSVERGDQVRAGELLYTLDRDSEDAAVERARARLDEARANYENLASAQRDTEIRALEAELAQAQADRKYAELHRGRRTALVSSGSISQAEMDQAESAFEAARARVDMVSARLERAREGYGRDAEIQAARAGIRAAEAELEQASSRQAKRFARAPLDGRIEDVLFREGETVQAGQPVVSLLPPDNVFVRFFASPKQVSRLSPGADVRLACEGCPDGLEARVSYVAREASFTPPTLYSRNRSEKLVFLVEARPHAHRDALRPGQPVRVTLPDPPIRNAAP